MTVILTPFQESFYKLLNKLNFQIKRDSFQFRAAAL